MSKRVSNKALRPPYEGRSGGFVNWDQHHSVSERLATDAESARRSGQMEKADELYRQAGSAEAAAFAALPPDRHRTRGVTAVSAVALWYKGRQYPAAERLAHTYLAGGDLPSFGAAQLQDLLAMIAIHRDNCDCEA